MSESSESPIKGIFEKFVPVLLLATVVLAFMVGVLWQKVNGLEKGTTNTNNVAGTTDTQPAQPQVSLDTIKGLFSKDLIKFGDENKKVLFVEISDPSCPFCHAAAGKNPELSRQIDTQSNSFKLTTDGGKYQAPVPEMKKLVDEGKASFVWIYSPGHGNGEMGTKALYCAQEKGKFWEVHDLLMSNAGYNLLNDVVKNDKTKAGELEKFLKSAIDSEEFNSCLEGDKYDSRLSADEAVATTLGYQGTPDFFVNDTNFGGAVNYTSMKDVVEAALK